MLTASLPREFPRWRRWVSMVSGAEEVPIGRSPRDAVYTRDRLAIYRYRRETPSPYRTPILLVYSLVNRPAILDLMPGRSVVEHLVQRGFDVYLLDWGVPDAMDSQVGLDLYVNLLLRTAVRQVCRIHGVERISLLGYCMGGTLTAIYSALYPTRVENLLLLGAPIDFRSDQQLYKWGTDPEFFDPAEIVAACGNAPTWVFEGFNLLAAGRKLPGLVTLYDSLDNPAFVENYLAMEQWVGDNIPMAGACYEEFIRTCWHQNRLVQGTLEVGNRAVDLGKIACPTLVIAGTSDHLVPPETTLPILDFVAEGASLVFPSGHVGLSVSSSSHRKLWPQVCDWLSARSGLQTVLPAPAIAD